MSFSPSFTVSQSAAAPATVVFTDDSSGSDGAIVSRRIYVTDQSGSAVVPSGTSTAYISWILATNPLSVSNLLTQDTAVDVLVQWLDSGNNVLYSSEDTFCLEDFGKQFFIYLFQQQALAPNIVQDSNYFGNLCQFWINLIGANTMITEAEDLSSSQNCLNRETYMAANQNLYF